MQVYAAKPDSGVERPVVWLAGFATVDLPAGQAADVPVPLAARALQHRDPERGWVTEPGTYRLEVGRSVADRRVVRELRVRAAT